MSHTRTSEQLAEIPVENIGGIDETSVSVSSGVTSLTGRNATNRTSLLRAFMAALGSNHVSLKGDADEGQVELILGEEEENIDTRTLMREHGTVVMGGEPYLDDPEGADLFAFLLENNEARQAVARDEDLREVIMRPVDTDAIQAEISQLEDQIADKRAELADKEVAIENADSTVDDTRERKAEFEDALDAFQEARSDLDDVRYRLDSERDSIQALEDERDEISTELEELSESRQAISPTSMRKSKPTSTNGIV